MPSVTQKITENVTVGSANLFINGTDVGHLKETIEFEYVREKLGFKPANMLGEVKAYPITERAEIRAKSAELNLTNIRAALGMSDTAVTESTTLTYNESCSYTPAALSSWDSLTFGGDKSESEICVRVEHTRPNGKIFIVILYKAISMSELILPFAEDEFTLYDLHFKGLADSDRSAGDEIGIMFDQVN
jgi:hypothetical protein